MLLQMAANCLSWTSNVSGPAVVIEAGRGGEAAAVKIRFQHAEVVAPKGFHTHAGERVSEGC